MSTSNTWNHDEPRTGIKGAWDKFVGPGATLSENLVALIPATLFASFVLLTALYQNKSHWGIWHYIAAVFFAFDMVGGIATTATRAAKRWYFRAEKDWLHHLSFVAPHITHLAIFSWLFVGDSLIFFVLFSALLLTGTLVICWSSTKINRSVAHLMLFLVIILANDIQNQEALMQWFIPALFIKLFASYLPRETNEQER